MTAPAQLADATRRAGVLWLSAPGADPLLVWHLWHDGSAYVVGGGGEQQLPPLDATARVTVRGPDGPLHWDADVEMVLPGTPLWDEVTPLLAAERLNAPAVEGLPETWAQTCSVLRLTPAGDESA